AESSGAQMARLETEGCGTRQCSGAPRSKRRCRAEARRYTRKRADSEVGPYNVASRMRTSEGTLPRQESGAGGSLFLQCPRKPGATKTERKRGGVKPPLQEKEKSRSPVPQRTRDEG